MRARNVVLVQTALLLCTTLQSLSQIKGVITDGAGATLSKTTIRVLDGKTRRAVETAHGDAYGHFELNDLSPGRYAIAFSSGGFSPELIEVDTTQAGAGTLQTIRLHARACDAPNENCDTFSDKPIPDTHPIVAHGTMTIGRSGAVDLNKRALVAPTSQSADFRLTEDDGGLYLTLLNGATRLSGCRTEFNHSRTNKESSALRIDGMGEDSEICIRTSHGRFSEIYLTREVQPDDKQIMIYVVTRR
jgi:hypothetical protein